MKQIYNNEYFNFANNGITVDGQGFNIHLVINYSDVNEQKFSGIFENGLEDSVGNNNIILRNIHIIYINKDFR